MKRWCPHCNGQLYPGFLEDQGQTTGSLRWIPGPLQKGLFGGTKLFGKKRTDVHAYRCTQCGRLELFVLPVPEQAPQDRITD